MSAVDKLFEKGKIGGLELKNRIIMPPMATRYATAEGFISDRSIDYYSERARGGVGLIIVEGAVILPDVTGALHIEDDRYIPCLARLTEIIHAEGIPAMLQINLSKGLKDMPNPTGPSPIPIPGKASLPRVLTAGDIAGLVEEYGKAAKRAMKAGFDGIMVHGGHGYLVSNFLSPLTNKRTDEYGGILSNRARLALELVEVARKNTDPYYPIVFRLMADEKMAGGFGLEDAIAVSKLLQEAGVSAIDIVAGGLVSEEWITPPMHMSPGCNAPLAEAIKRHIRIPVIVAGKINDPYVASSILEKGQADFVDMGRASIADPQFVRKLLAGRGEDIRKCIGCLKCRQAIAMPSPLVCTVNPVVGREREFGLKPVARSKRVLVVGGGPAGMMAAITARQRGHKVTLWEKSDKLGGQLNLALIPPGKGDLSNLLEYLMRQMARSSIHIALQKKATSAAVMQHQPDALILATGSNPIVPKIKGISNRRALNCREVLAGETKVGRKVIVIGGGYIGCELAELLASQGKDVTIVEVLKEIAQDAYPRVRRLYLERLREKRVKTITGVTGEEITERGMEIIDAQGKPATLGADSIILAVGASPEGMLGTVLDGKIHELHTIGDAAKARSLLEAVREGFEAAYKI